MYSRCTLPLFCGQNWMKLDATRAAVGDAFVGCR